MRELFFGKNTYSFPDKWEELSREQYLMLIDALLDFQSGKTNASGCRASWFCSIAGIETKKRDNKNDQFWENIYRASELFNFFLKIEYLDPKTNEPKSLKHLPREIRENLQKRPPSELPEYPEYRWASKLKYHYIIDAVFSKNLLPEINIKGRFYPGFRFGLSGNLLTTSLTARMFIDATMAYNAFVEEPGTEHLNMLIEVLYFKGQPQMVKSAINHAPERVKYGVLLNFQAMLAYLMNKTRYAVIWSRKPPENDNKNKLTVGLADAIYSLAKAGYGTVETLEKENLLTYLDLLLKNIIDSVLMLNENEVNIGEISERTGLTIQQIKKII